MSKSVREANTISFSVPSGMRCDNTAPTPYADASHANTNSSFQSKCTNTSDDTRSSFEASNAFLSRAVHLQGYCVSQQVGGVLTQLLYLTRIKNSMSGGPSMTSTLTQVLVPLAQLQLSQPLGAGLVHQSDNPETPLTLP